MKRDLSIKGFSLVEVMTVIFIILMMTGIVFANYRSGNQQFALELQAYRLAQDLRNAQEMSMSAKEIAGETPAGFGVYCTQGGTSYTIYADTYPNPGGNAVYDDTRDYVIQTVEFDRNIYIQTITPDLLSVNFAPPDPVTTLTGAAGPRCRRQRSSSACREPRRPRPSS